MLLYDAHEASYAKNVIELSNYDYANVLTVTLNNVTINAQNAKPVYINTGRTYEKLAIVETGTNSYTKDGTLVNYKGETL